MSKRTEKLGITEDDMKAELISHDMTTLQSMANIKDPEFKTEIHSLLRRKYDNVIDTDPNDLENTYAKMVGEGDYQCGSCEQFFDHTDDVGDCPHCSSGNIVEGSIDD